MKGERTGAVILKGAFPGDFSLCLEIILVVITGVWSGGCVTEWAKNVAKHPTLHRKAQHHQELCDPIF